MLDTAEATDYKTISQEFQVEFTENHNELDEILKNLHEKLNLLISNETIKQYQEAYNIFDRKFEKLFTPEKKEEYRRKHPQEIHQLKVARGKIIKAIHSILNQFGFTADNLDTDVNNDFQKLTDGIQAVLNDLKIDLISDKWMPDIIRMNSGSNH